MIQAYFLYIRRDFLKELLLYKNNQLEEKYIAAWEESNSDQGLSKLMFYRATTRRFEIQSDNTSQYEKTSLYEILNNFFTFLNNF